MAMRGFPSTALLLPRPAGTRARYGIAVVDEDGVVAGHPRPALDRGDDRLVVADLRRGLDPAVEQAADDALVDEVVADLELALGGQLRHARRGAGAAGRCGRSPCRRRTRRCGHGPSGFFGLPVHRMWLTPRMVGFSGWTNSILLVQQPAQDRATAAGSSPAEKSARSAVVLLRLDDGVEIAAIGDVERELARARDSRPSTPSAWR